MRVVVTGARGFVGRHMVRHLAASGTDVVALDNAAPPAEGLPGARFVTCDVRSPDTYRPALEGADALVHMASAHLQVGLPESIYWSVNVESLPGLLEAARSAGIRHVVHTSSVGVHGSLAHLPGDEDSPIAPENLYERTKAAGEAQVEGLRPGLTPLGITIVRPAWIYGAGDPRTERILRAVARGRFVLFGAGANYRHPIHIEDYLAGIDRLLLEPRTYGRTYILAGPTYLTTRDLLAAVERVTGGRIRLRVPLALGYAAALGTELAGRALGRAAPISRRTLAFFRNQNAFDTRRARAEFGFQPAIAPDEGLASVWALVGARA